MEENDVVTAVFKTEVVVVSLDRSKRRTLHPGKFELKLVLASVKKFRHKNVPYLCTSDKLFGLPIAHWQMLEKRGDVLFEHKVS